MATNYEFAVVIPNRYVDIIRPLLDQIRLREERCEVVIVRDGHQDTFSDMTGMDLRLVDYDMPAFKFARAANLGILKASRHKDIILMNDDIRLEVPGTLKELCRYANFEPKVGILSPLIRGVVGTAYQRWHDREQNWKEHEIFKILGSSDSRVCFPCIYLKRIVIETAGLIPECYYGYGREDIAYCAEVIRHGWNLGVTQRVHAVHGDGTADPTARGKSWSCSFARRYPDVLHATDDEEEIYVE